MNKFIKIVSWAICGLGVIFLCTCLVVGTLGLWHLAFGWPS